jgi:hypothetical protein
VTVDFNGELAFAEVRRGRLGESALVWEASLPGFEGERDGARACTTYTP